MLHHHCRRNPELQEELQIQAAVAAGDVHTVRKMLEQGYSPNGRDANGWTLLHFSAARGKERCVRVFLEHGGEFTGCREKAGLAFVENALVHVCMWILMLRLRCCPVSCLLFAKIFVTRTQSVIPNQTLEWALFTLAHVISADSQATPGYFSQEPILGQVTSWVSEAEVVVVFPMGELPRLPLLEIAQTEEPSTGPFKHLAPSCPSCLP